MEKETLADLLSQGMSSREVARQLATSQTNVRYWVKKYGLKLSPRRAERPTPGLSKRELQRLQEKATGRRTCTKCGQTKDIEQFNFRSKRLDKRSPQCAECERAYARGYYAKTLQAQRVRAARLNTDARDAVLAKLLEYLQDKQCVDCGERDPAILEFDHVTGTKRDAIGKMISSWRPRWDSILEEIEQCQIRCVNCHRRKTASERGYFKDLNAAQPAGDVVGSLSAESAPAADLPARAVCTKCGEEKDLTEFTYRDASRRTRHRQCRSCKQAVSRAYRLRNKSASGVKAARQNRRNRAQNRERLMAWLTDKACVDCGERDPVVLEFDHVRGEKQAAVAEMVASGTFSWSTILAEIAKCDIRCGNCHRRKTARERGWYRAQTQEE